MGTHAGQFTPSGKKKLRRGVRGNGGGKIRYGDRIKSAHLVFFLDLFWVKIVI